jgi:hypothetical protein
MDRLRRRALITGARANSRSLALRLPGRLAPSPWRRAAALGALAGASRLLSGMQVLAIPADLKRRDVEQ